MIDLTMGAQEVSLETSKILVVDDPADNIKLLSEMLSRQGYTVEQCQRGDLAIEVAKRRVPDLILMDVNMPGMNGFEVCKKLKADPDTEDIPIIFITALHEVRKKFEAFKYGGDDYITKPFQVEELLARVGNQLQISRLKAELKAKNARLERELLERQLIETELLELNQRLSKLAALDSLTQIANRRIFDEFLTKEWQRGQREQQCLSLILADIDHFKLYNDSLGHQSGDWCLRKVAEAIVSAVKRPADLVARYGGEEFAVILPQTPADNALLVANQIRQKVKELALSHPKSLVSSYVTLSLGVTSLIPHPQYTEKQLLVTADKALYQAKKQGRDRAILINIE